MVSPVKDEAWLEWMARLLGEPLPRPRQAARLPASSFYCLLDEQPTHLFPQRFIVADGWETSATGPLLVNPDCHFSHDREPPPLVAELPHLPESFAWEGAGEGAWEGKIAWVRDPATEIILPFWLGPRLSGLLANLQSGDAVPADFPADFPANARSVLAAAGILVEDGYAARRRQEWAEIVGHCAARFREKSYVPIGRLIHPYYLAALRRYYRYLIRNGKLQLGDEHNPRRYVAHNEAVARFFHLQLTTVISSIVGEPVKPSYVYVASYLAGEDLKRHTDRPQCEFSISLCLDFSPEPVRETSWPLYLDTKTGKLTVYQAIGDGLLYRGRELPHYRDPLPPGNTSTSIFFHYVREDFSGPLD
jgi:hypothetical protein